MRGREGVEAPAPATACANWLCSELLGRLHAQGQSLPEACISPQDLAEVVLLVHSGAISGRIGKQLLDALISAASTDAARTPWEVVQANGWVQVTDGELISALVRAVVEEDRSGASADDALAAWPAEWRSAIAPSGDTPSGAKKAKRKKARKGTSAVDTWLTSGNERVLGALTGRALALSNGKAAPDLVAAELAAQLAALKSSA